MLFLAKDKHAITSADYAALGLECLNGTTPRFRETLGQGIVFAADETPGSILARLTLSGRLQEKVGYNPESQVWIDCGAFAVGWWADKPPTPESLMRPDALGGEKMLLGDGNEWAIPRPESIPFDFCIESGDVGHKPSKAYADYYAAVERIGDGVADGTMPLMELLDRMAVVLAVNYRINTKIAAALGLFNSANLQDAAAIAICMDRMFAMQKSVAEKKT